MWALIDINSCRPKPIGAGLFKIWPKAGASISEFPGRSPLLVMSCQYRYSVLPNVLVILSMQIEKLCGRNTLVFKSL
ncbi:MAG TPA: hypothetical protein VEC36_01280 [Patescibacteria group bacterium]|nr:hypothetical protein [Patescibacteria group bacterium]